MQPEMTPLSEIYENPDNPRQIDEKKFDSLVKSLTDFPEMITLRPIVVNKENIILGGNMRYKALVHLGIKEVPVIKATNLTPEQEREFVIKDNVSGGEWDWDILANEWDGVELEEWGLDLPFDTDFSPEKEEAEEGTAKGVKTCPNCGQEI